MYYIGIDPGKSGACAIIHLGRDVGREMEAFLWDDRAFIDKMSLIAHSGEQRIACVEKVGAMPGQGVTSMFSFGKSAGFIEGVLCALAIPYQLVPPRVWKKAYSLGSDKGQSVSVCQRLFPEVSLLPTPRCHKPSDGMAEALLMAHYAERRLG